MSGDRAGKLGFGTEDIGLAAAVKPTHLLSWHAGIKFHPNNVFGNKHSQASQMHLW